MENVISVSADSTLKITLKSKFLDNIRKAHTWYTSQAFATPMLALFAVMDIGGFYHIAQATISSNVVIRLLIISSFAVAFEIAPLYIGYAICLKSYKLGKSIHDVILGLSITSFVLGIVCNTVYRILTMEYAKLSDDENVSLAITIIMIILPIITSFMNLVIGCLSFDPLFFDVAKLTKKCRKLSFYKRQLEGRLHELKDDDNMYTQMEKAENDSYEKTKKEIMLLRYHLRNYIIIHK